MLKQEERDIGDRRFQVTQMPAGRGRKLLVRLSKVIGPTLAAGLQEMPEGDEEATVGDLPVRALSGAIFELCEKLTEADLDYVCSQLAGDTKWSEDGESWTSLSSKGQFDLVFAGRYLDMLKWIGFGLEVNFADFFGESGALEKARQALAVQAATRSASQPRSTGGSTGSPRPRSTPTA